jgi:hypothetical protein
VIHSFLSEKIILLIQSNKVQNRIISDSGREANIFPGLFVDLYNASFDRDHEKIAILYFVTIVHFKRVGTNKKW